MRELLLGIGKTGAGSLLSLLFGAVTMKVIALTAGPAGMGFFSLVRQVNVTGGLLAALNGQPALVQGIASRAGRERSMYVAAVARVLAVSTALVALLVLIGAPWLARAVFPDAGPGEVNAVRWLALGVVAAAGYTFLTGVLNGHRALGRLAAVQVTSVAAMAVLAYPAVRLANRGWPAAYSWLLAASSVAGCVVALRMLRSLETPMAAAGPAPAGASSGGDTAAVGRAFLRVAGTMLLAGLGAHGTHLAVRAAVGARFGLDGAGLFDVAFTFSMTYVMLILTSLQGYYLPALSQATRVEERTLLVQRLFRIAVLALVPAITAVVVLKPAIIGLLYADAFLPAGRIMNWMLIGDYFKVSAWVLAMPMLSLLDMRTFLWTEVAWSASWLGGSVVLSAVTGSPEGVGMAFAASYLLYLAGVGLLARRRYGVRLGASHWGAWLAGLAVLVGATWHAGDAWALEWRVVVPWIVVGTGFSVVALRRDGRARVAHAVRAAARRGRSREVA